MNDPSVNFYDVVNAAEAYFETHGKGKGSGWKGYQRWKFENEPKFFPTGDRTAVNHYLPEKEFQKFVATYGNSGDRALFDDGWEALGPFSIDSVTGHYSAGLGRIETFYVDPADDDRLYLGSRSGGFWKSLDGGASWTGSTTAFEIASGVNTMTVSPTDPNIVLVNLKNAQNSTSHGIFRSTDAGDSWEMTPFNPENIGWGGLGDNESIYKVAYHPTVPGLVFVCTSEGLYRSDDDLASWINLLPSGIITEIEFHPTNPDIVYVYDSYYWSGNRDHIYTSTDMGLSWTLGNEIIGNDNSSGEISASGDCPDCLYFASTNGVWKSEDNGMNFDLISVPTGSCDGFVVNDLDTSVMIYGYLDTYKSLNGGQTFSLSAGWTMSAADYWSGDYVHADLREAKCYDGVFYLSSDGLFVRSYDNGTTWEILTNDVNIRENYNLGVSQSNHYRSIAGSQDNGTSIKKKDTWVEFYGADGMEGIIHPLQDDYMITSLQYGGRRRTLTGGTTQSGATPSGQNGGWIAPLFYDPNDQMTVYSVGENVWRSEDFGSSWTMMGSPSFGGTMDFGTIAENNSNIIVLSNNDDIAISYNQGVSFADIGTGLPNYSITDIAFDPNDDNVIVVTYGHYQEDGQKVFISYDQGGSWSNITYNLGNMPIRSVVIDHTDESNIYLGAEIGVFTMPIGGGLWTLYNEDLPNVSTRELEVVWGSNTLRGATWGSGLWEYTLVGRQDYPAILECWNSDKPTFEIPTDENPQLVSAIISYDGELSEVYCQWSVDAPTFENTIEMYNYEDSTWKTVKPIPAMDEGTKVFFKVFAIGESGDTTETYKFMYEVQPFGYCIAEGHPGTGSDYLNYMELNGVSNPSGQEYYGDFTAVEIELWEDSTYTLELGLNYAWNPDTCGAWIDYNHNGSFEDEEFILMSEINLSTFESFGEFTVPDVEFYTDIPVRMRVRNLYWDTPPTPCGIIAGEVEDYTIIVRGYPDMIGYEISNDTICKNDEVSFEYCGETADSIQWTFSNGTDSFSFTGEDGTLAILEGGNYDLQITLYKYGVPAVYDYPGALYVHSFNLDVATDVMTLTAEEEVADYQWIDCSDWSLIPGATDQAYTTPVDGDFAVILNNDYCIDTSACFTINTSAILENDFEHSILLYPNPTKGVFNIDLGEIRNKIAIKAYDVNGSVVFDTFVLDNSMAEIDITSLADGIYYFHIESEGKKAVIRVSKI